ncbi:predicted protein [Postia placenta Mad-698-R]|nr:predicted protein [Postia placenta Mad-698-R]
MSDTSLIVRMDAGESKVKKTDENELLDKIDEQDGNTDDECDEVAVEYKKKVEADKYFKNPPRDCSVLSYAETSIAKLYEALEITETQVLADNTIWEQDTHTVQLAVATAKRKGDRCALAAHARIQSMDDLRSEVSDWIFLNEYSEMLLTILHEVDDEWQIEHDTLKQQQKTKCALESAANAVQCDEDQHTTSEGLWTKSFAFTTYINELVGNIELSTINMSMDL